MTEIFKPRDSKIYKDWIKTIIEEASDTLSDWEGNFIDSIETQLARGYTLSQRQDEILEKIYAARTK